MAAVLSTAAIGFVRMLGGPPTVWPLFFFAFGLVPMERMRLFAKLFDLRGSITLGSVARLFALYILFLLVGVGANSVAGKVGLPSRFEVVLPLLMLLNVGLLHLSIAKQIARDQKGQENADLG